VRTAGKEHSVLVMMIALCSFYIRDYIDKIASDIQSPASDWIDKNMMGWTCSQDLVSNVRCLDKFFMTFSDGQIRMSCAHKSPA
jgi:hypothetical protein